MSLPLMYEAFSGLTQQAQFAILNKTQENFNTVESIEVLGYIQASLQPLHPREILLKPEGLRRWKWYTMICKDDMPVGNYIMDAQGIQYRIMSKQDWRTGGSDFVRYEIIQSSKAGSEAP